MIESALVAAITVDGPIATIIKNSAKTMPMSPFFIVIPPFDIWFSACFVVNYTFTAFGSLHLSSRLAGRLTADHHWACTRAALFEAITDIKSIQELTADAAFSSWIL